MFVLAVQLAFTHLKQRVFSRLVVVTSVACVLLINALVLVLFQSFAKTLAEVQSAQYITAYINREVLASKELEVLSAVKKINGVQSAQLISKDNFVENFSKYFPQLSSEISNLDIDTVPRYIKIKSNSASSELLKNKLETLPGIEQVELNKNRFVTLISALQTLKRFAFFLLVGMTLTLACVLISHFKVKSAYQNQVQSTLRLLGAKKFYCYLPFLIEGSIEGLMAGVIAATTILVYGVYLENNMNHLFVAIGYQPYHFSLISISLGLVVSGILSGMVGSTWAALRVK